MRIMIVGLGMMGLAAAVVAAAELPLTRLHLVDSNLGRAVAAAQDVTGRIGGRKAEVTASDHWSESEDEMDVALLALPGPQTTQFLNRVRDLPLAVVSMARPPVSLDETAPEAVRERVGSTLLPVGLEPGLTEILLAWILAELDRVESAELLCGGLTVERPTGFPYRMLFGGSTLPFAARPAFTLVGGRRTSTERFAGVQSAKLPGLPSLESYHDGMVPWLHTLPAVEGVNVEQRTIRWPGFVHAVSLLRAGGFLDDDETEVAGVRLVPRRMTDELLGRRIQRAPDEREVTHLQVTARGRVGGRAAERTINVWCRDDQTPLSSGMACLTAVPAVLAAARVLEFPHRSGWIRTETAFSANSVQNIFMMLRHYGAQVHGDVVGRQGPDART